VNDLTVLKYLEPPVRHGRSSRSNFPESLPVFVAVPRCFLSSCLYPYSTPSGVEYYQGFEAESYKFVQTIRAMKKLIGSIINPTIQVFRNVLIVSVKKPVDFI
jgi:hypothetical protein